MSRNGSISFIWADGPHTFRLGLGEIRELQEKTDAGPMELLRRVDAGNWRVDELRETLRLGLIGGGMKAESAYKLIQRYASEPPFGALQMSARAILMAAVIGAPDGEKPGKRRAAKVAADEPQSSQTESSPSPPSTVQPQS